MSRLSVAGSQPLILTIYCMRFWDGPKTIERDGLTLVGICKRRSQYSRKGRRSIVQAGVFGLASFRLIFRKFDVLEIDQIPYVQLITGWLIARVRGVPLCSTWHEVMGVDQWRRDFGSVAGSLLSLVERFACRLPDLIVCVSLFTERRLFAIGRRTRTYVIENSSLIGPVGHSSPKPAVGLDVDFIYTGRLEAHKNLDKALLAMAMVHADHPDARLLVVGEGSELYRLKTLSDGLGLGRVVNFLPFLRQDRLFNVILRSHVYICLSDHEGSAIAVLDALAAGLVVLASDSRDNAVGFLPSANVFLVNHSDPDDVMAGMLVRRGVSRFT